MRLCQNKNGAIRNRDRVCGGIALRDGRQVFAPWAPDGDGATEDARNAETAI
jgi:hypothetical protein